MLDNKTGASYIYNNLLEKNFAVKNNTIVKRINSGIVFYYCLITNIKLHFLLLHKLCLYLYFYVDVVILCVFIHHFTILKAENTAV